MFAVEDSAKVRGHRRLGFLRASRQRPGDRHRHALRRAQRLLRPRRHRRCAGGVHPSPRAGPSHPAGRDQLPRQHLGHEGAGCAARAVGLRRRESAPGARASPRRGARPVVRPHQGAPEHLLRRWRRRAHELRGPVLPAYLQALRRAGARRQRDSARRRHLRLHRGTAVLHARRVQRLPQLRLRHHRHDRCSQEAKLAREAELCYATLAMVTDYDVWYRGRKPTCRSNRSSPTYSATARLRRPSSDGGVGALDHERDCTCRHAVKSAVNTPAELIPQATKDRVDLLIGKYLR